MKVLILGGTQFLGKHLTQELLNQGHDVTHFNRGNNDKPDEVKTIVGDRYDDIKFISDDYDAIVDTSGYFPSNMEEVCSHLKEKTKHFIFLSSCSVYDYTVEGISSITEDSKTVSLEIDREKDDLATYGARKFLCEEIVSKYFPDSCLNIRPGLIVGPHDTTYRFAYWADRISDGGQVLVPDDKNAPLQFIDARDLASWIGYCLKERIAGTYNAVSPCGEYKLLEFLDEVKSLINSDTQFIRASEDFLKENNVSCWSDLPLWVYKEIQAFLLADSSKAIASGLKFRPVKESIIDTHDWSKKIYKDKFLSKVLSREKEAELVSILTSK